MFEAGDEEITPLGCEESWVWISDRFEFEEVQCGDVSTDEIRKLALSEGVSLNQRGFSEWLAG